MTGEEHEKAPYRLSDEQVAEVRRRMADEDAATLTLAELDAHLRRIGATTRRQRNK